MNAEVLVARLRTFLLGLTVVLCLGVIAELLLTEHTQEPLQWVPIVLSVLGIAGAVAVMARPSRNTLWALRGVMLVAGISALAGMYFHLTGNIEIVREVNAAKAAAEPLVVALTGHNPPLAPGAMAVTALVAWAATYAHPALKSVAERAGVQTTAYRRG